MGAESSTQDPGSRRSGCPSGPSKTPTHRIKHRSSPSRVDTNHRSASLRSSVISRDKPAKHQTWSKGKTAARPPTHPTKTQDEGVTTDTREYSYSVGGPPTTVPATRERVSYLGWAPRLSGGWYGPRALLPSLEGSRGIVGFSFAPSPSLPASVLCPLSLSAPRSGRVRSWGREESGKGKE